MRVSIPAPEVSTRLQAELDPEPAQGRRWGYWLSRHHQFFGQVTANSFRIYKWWGGQRLDDPVLVGTIQPDGSGSLIAFEIMPATLSILFLGVFTVVWLSVWLIVFPGVVTRAANWSLWSRVFAGVFVLPLDVFFWWLLRNEAKALLGFLEERLGDVKQ